VFASGAPGVIYAVKTNGDLVWYRDNVRNGTNLSAGASAWSGPSPVGNGWQRARHVFGGQMNSSSSTYPNGVLYVIAEDYTLRWYRDTLQNGTNGIGGNVGWVGGATRIIGTSWNFL